MPLPLQAQQLLFKAAAWIPDNFVLSLLAKTRELHLHPKTTNVRLRPAGLRLPWVGEPAVVNVLVI